MSDTLASYQALKAVLITFVTLFLLPFPLLKTTGDDDTLFFLPGVMRLVRRLGDPLVPVAATDNLWLLQQRPNPAAPRCLPCRGPIAATAGLAGRRRRLKVAGATSRRSLSGASIRVPPALVDYLPPVACPSCTPEKACAPILDPPRGKVREGEGLAYRPPSPPPVPWATGNGDDGLNGTVHVSPFLAEDMAAGDVVPLGRWAQTI